MHETLRSMVFKTFPARASYTLLIAQTNPYYVTSSTREPSRISSISMLSINNADKLIQTTWNSSDSPLQNYILNLYVSCLGQSSDPCRCSSYFSRTTLGNSRLPEMSHWPRQTDTWFGDNITKLLMNHLWSQFSFWFLLKETIDYCLNWLICISISAAGSILTH